MDRARLAPGGLVVRGRTCAQVTMGETPIPPARPVRDGGDPHTPGPAGSRWGRPPYPRPGRFAMGETPIPPARPVRDGGDPHTPGPAGSRWGRPPYPRPGRSIPP